MFNLNLVTGIIYLVAVIGAFYKKLIFRRKNIAWMIISGTILSYLARLLLPYVLGSYLAGDILSTLIIGAITLAIWIKAWNLKKGKKS